jgi:hypothetical protein
MIQPYSAILGALRFKAISQQPEIVGRRSNTETCIAWNELSNHVLFVIMSGWDQKL